MLSPMKYLAILLFLVPMRIEACSLQKVKRIDPFVKEIQCMADNIYYEAAGEPIEGKIAVAQVVINRTHYRFYPHTVCGVVYDHAQFSWTLHKLKHKKAKDYRKIVKLARAVLTKKVRSDIIGTNVIYYHNDKITPPAWAEDNKMVAVIGRHIFYARGNIISADSRKSL